MLPRNHAYVLSNAQRYTQNRSHRNHITAHQLDQDQDLLTELRILSSLRAQDRISTNHAVKPVVRIQKPDVMRSLCRFFGSESRASNVAYIQSLLQRVIDRYASAIHNGDRALQNRICEETESAVQGVRRLQQTYEDDAQFQATLNVSIDTVCIHLGLNLLEDRPMVPMAPPGAPGERHPDGARGSCDDSAGVRKSVGTNKERDTVGNAGVSRVVQDTGPYDDYTQLPPMAKRHNNAINEDVGEHSCVMDCSTDWRPVGNHNTANYWNLGDVGMGGVGDNVPTTRVNTMDDCEDVNIAGDTDGDVAKMEDAPNVDPNCDTDDKSVIETF